MSLFEQVKDRLSMEEVALMYGVQANRSHFCHCPFHNERTASMRLYEKSYYCFGCHKGGDVISFVAEMLNISQYEAAKQLAGQFNITPTKQSKLRQYAFKRKQQEIKEQKAEQEQVELMEDALLTLYSILYHAKQNRKHYLFWAAQVWEMYVNYYLDCFYENPLEFTFKEREVIHDTVERIIGFYH